MKFLENLGFTSTNDRLFIGILKELGFLNRDGQPQPRYFEFLDRSRSQQVVAAGIREAFADLFAVNTQANEMKFEEVRNKLRTLFAGKKTDLVIKHIAKTFKALCAYADFTTPLEASNVETVLKIDANPNGEPPAISTNAGKPSSPLGKITVSGLQYHINIVLPDIKDQAVYDAIFKSLRAHLG